MRMSTAFLFIALAAVAAALVSGSASAADITGFGLKGGLSVSTLHGRLPTDALFQNETRLGAGGGVSLCIRLGEHVWLQPEVLYVAKGTSLGKIGLSDSSGEIGRAHV